MIYNALSIAGSDPSGGAGIQADLKSFSANGVYGMAVLTALTAQNTKTVSAIHTLPTDFVRAQIDMIFADIHVHAVKIGMLANSQIAHCVAEILQDKSCPLILDPVLVATSGASLLSDDAPVMLDVLKNHLLPLADIITPNLPEAAALLGCELAKNRDDMQSQAADILDMGVKNVYIKGGHLADADNSPDLLCMRIHGTQRGIFWLEGKRVPPPTNTLPNTPPNTHGTGCSLSAALAAGRARGLSAMDAAHVAKNFIQGAIAQAENLQVGDGHGPIHHFHRFWPKH